MSTEPSQPESARTARLASFEQALASLHEYVEEPIRNKRDGAGIVQGFEIAFELMGKCLQDRLTDLGYQERGPRLVLPGAIRAGIIREGDEPGGREMLEDRNLAAHMYRAPWAQALVERGRTRHLPKLQQVFEALTAE